MDLTPHPAPSTLLSNPPSRPSPPQTRRPLLGRHGLQIRASSCVSRSNSALMFERAWKIPATARLIFYGPEMWKTSLPHPPPSSTPVELMRLMQSFSAFLRNIGASPLSEATRAQQGSVGGIIFFSFACIWVFFDERF